MGAKPIVTYQTAFLPPPEEPSGEVQVSRPTARWLRCLFAGKSDLLSPSLADKGLSVPSNAWAEGQGRDAAGSVTAPAG